MQADGKGGGGNLTYSSSVIAFELPNSRKEKLTSLIKKEVKNKLAKAVPQIFWVGTS
jgi:hypothetical protein